MAFLTVDQMSYVSYIEQTHLFYRGKGMQLTPLEYEQIYQWMEQNVPASVVCDALRSEGELCQSEERKYPRSLLYFKAPVKDRFNSYLEKQVGWNP